MKIFIIAVFSLFLSININSQVNFSGFVFDSSGEPLPGAFIEDFSNKRNSTVSNITGQFNIQLASESSIIKISFIGYESMVIRIDTANRINYKFKLSESKNKSRNIVVIAPNPSAIEFGYYGLINSHPIGAHFEYFSRADIFQTYLNYANDGLKNNYFEFELGPYRLGSYENWKYYRPYFKGVIDEAKSNLLFCNEFGLRNIGLVADLGLDVGVGINNMNYNQSKIIFLTGIRKYLNLPFPFFISYFKFDIIYNKSHCDYLSNLYIELYNKNYRKLTFNLGYQSIFDKKDFVLGLNYKYYFL